LAVAVKSFVELSVYFACLCGKKKDKSKKLAVGSSSKNKINIEQAE